MKLLSLVLAQMLLVNTWQVGESVQTLEKAELVSKENTAVVEVTQPRTFICEECQREITDWEAHVRSEHCLNQHSEHEHYYGRANECFREPQNTKHHYENKQECMNGINRNANHHNGKRKMRHHS